MGLCLRPKHLDAKRDPAVVVVKNGRTTGTTVGCMSGLKSLVCYYKLINIEFTSRELAVVPHDNKPGRSPLSDEGDWCSVERGGRVAVLTARGGITDAANITFASPYINSRISGWCPFIYSPSFPLIVPPQPYGTPAMRMLRGKTTEDRHAKRPTSRQERCRTKVNRQQPTRAGTDESTSQSRTRRTWERSDADRRRE